MIALLQEEGTGRNLEAASCSAAAAAAATELATTCAEVKLKRVTGNKVRCGFCRSLLHLTFSPNLNHKLVLFLVSSFSWFLRLEGGKTRECVRNVADICMWKTQMYADDPFTIGNVDKDG